MYMTPEELLSFLPGQSVIELTNDDPRGTEPDMDKVAEALRAIDDGFGLDAVAVCLTDALQALCDLTGEDAADATIDEVFETFCVGK